jgi:hypothetical protein
VAGRAVRSMSLLVALLAVAVGGCGGPTASATSDFTPRPSPDATATPAPPTNRPGQFRQAAAMTSGRLRATATLLNDGRVLIVGGVSGGRALSSAEVYDPATGQFAATGSMAVARSGHTATLLPGGRVLVAGGTIDQSAEVYDPAKGTFSMTGLMVDILSRRSSTILADGRVMFAGGQSVLGRGADIQLLDGPVCTSAGDARCARRSDRDPPTGRAGADSRGRSG